MLPKSSAETVKLPRQVVKRDGSRVPFDQGKIRYALQRAGQASGELGPDEARLLTAQVVKVLSYRYRQGQAPAIERIQDVVEQVLISANHLDTARRYIVYREQHKQLRQDRRTLVDVSSSVNEDLETSTRVRRSWRSW